MQNVKITVFLKLIVAFALIVGAATKQEYSYYTFLRCLVMVSFIYFAYIYYIKHQIGLFIFFIATALLFNPFIKFWFQKNTWHLIDYIIAGISAATFIFDLKNKKINT